MKQLFATIFTFIVTFAHCFAQTNDAKLKISHLTGDYYVYTTYSFYKGEQVPANGMYLLTDSGAVLFDTPWDTTQFHPLLDSIANKHHQKVLLCIATHWHDDRTSGLEYYQQQGIKTYTTALTDQWSKKKGMKRAEFLFKNDTTFSVAQHHFSTYYPGPGHTEDNIVIWFPKDKILYGGCLIKGASAASLGNLSDANVNEYETTLKNVKRKFPHPKYIIVSHHDWHNNRSLKHSIKLAIRLK